MKEIRARVHDDQYDEIRQFAYSHGVSLAQLNRYALDEYLRKRGIRVFKTAKELEYEKQRKLQATCKHTRVERCSIGKSDDSYAQWRVPGVRCSDCGKTWEI